MSSADSTDVFRDTYLKLIQETLECLNETVNSLAMGNKTQAIAVRTKIEQVLNVLTTVPQDRLFICMGNTLINLKDQLTGYIDSDEI